jgi:endonuclease/exonuclease/phosphatase family metal-dependent hydrolase/uncharacterized protein (UPF0248 family)
MRTSEEIYHRVRWDPRFDPARFTLGILVRGAPAKRVALSSFVPGGEIPWHRVLFVEADGEVVWDRAAGVDRLDSTSAGRVREAGLLPTFFTGREVRGAGTAVPGARLRVLTWNTLWDRYNSAHIDTARRRPLLLEELARADADVIALQEVEPALYDMLALDGYAVSGGADVREHGLVLLSRLPVLAAGHHVLSPHKGVAAMVVRTAGGPVAVLATHLTSDHHPEGPQRRARELARLVVGLDIDCPVVLLGDFNGGAVEQLGLEDAWTAIHDDETPTFDPSGNPLAALSSLSGQAGRLDRVLVRGVRPVAAELVGTTGPLFVSDHYGVLAALDVVPDEVPTAVAWRPVLRGALGWEPDELPVEPLRGVLSDVFMQVANALDSATIDVVGSRRMRCANPGADMDLVAAVERDVDVDRLVVPGAERRRRVDARVPGLRFRLDGVFVDLTVVSVPRGMSSDDAVERRDELAPGSAMALSAVSDAEAVLAAVGDRDDAFSTLARTVKAWAAARGLDSAPHGGLPGIAWAVLAARTVREAGGDDLLAAFFERWAAWDWREPVTLLGDPAPRTSDPMTVLTPSAPVRSCTSQVGAGMRDLVSAELYAAWETVTAGGDPVPATAPHRRHAAWAVVTVTKVRGEKIDVTVGRLRGRVRALLDLLPPDTHAWPAPFDETGAVTRFAIGLGVTPPTAGELAEAAERWGELPGVRVEWATNSTAT